MDEVRLQADLHTLVTAELLYQRGHGVQAIYRFKHALVQETAYQSLLTRTRQQYHQRIAQTLEEHFVDTAETEPELLAHHYTEAGLGESAVVWWQRAGERAEQRSAYHEAMAHLMKGLAGLESLPETPTRVDCEIRLQLALSRSLRATKGHAALEVRHASTRALELCRQHNDPLLHLRALAELRLFHTGRAEHRQAIETAAETLHVAQRLQNPVLLADAHYDMGLPLYMCGRWGTAVDHFSHSLRYADPHEMSRYLIVAQIL
jgi:predicted ATPase